MSHSHPRPPSLAALHAEASALKQQVQSLGGKVSSMPGIEESNPAFMIQFYKRVLETERKIARTRPSIGVN